MSRTLLLILIFLGFSQSVSAKNTIQGMDKTHYIAGGITGTVVGFGIGHGIQNRYNDLGWVFTISDAVAVGAIIAGSLISTPRVLGTGLWVSGVLVLVGFRVWQALDLWITPTGALTFSDRSDLKPDPLYAFNTVSKWVPRIGVSISY